MNEKIQWHSEVRVVKDLKHWDKNPRLISTENFSKLKERITKRGFHDVLKIDLHDTILSGNQRQDALLDLGIEKVNVLVPSRELTEQEKDEIALESNRNDGEWDFSILANEFDVEILKDIGFTEIELGLDTIKLFDSNKYTNKISAPIYEPKNEKPLIGELFNIEKYQKLVSEIENSSLNNEEKEFLKLSATRHIVFDYEKIADFYSHSSKECQELMESAALVIIDFDKAIELGYAQLSKDIDYQFNEEYKENDEE